MKHSAKLFWLFIVFTSQLYSQQEISYAMPQIVGQTPDVASLLKFSETSVSYSTGVPNISIPIFTLPSTDLSASVSLSYHAGGIRVTEEASSVGLGWSLFAGGQITRTVRSFPDDTGTNGFIHTEFTVPYIKSLCETGATDNYNKNCHNYTGTYAQDQRYDYQPDDFNYSMMGQSGRFMFNQNRLNSPYGEIVQFPHKNVIITPQFLNNSSSNPSGKIVAWNITDTNGTIYRFEEGNTYHSNQVFQKVNTGLEIPNGGGDNLEYTETWDLVSVTSHTGDVISFNYQTPALSYLDANNILYNEHSCIESSEALIVHEGDNMLTLPKRVKAFSDTKRKYTVLSSIVTSQGRIEFILDSQLREDTQSEKRRIKYIELYDSHNKLMKQVELVTNYFLSTPSTESHFIGTFGTGSTVANASNFLNKRLALNEVIFRGGESVTNNTSGDEYKYVLDYNTQTMLPHKRSYAQDHWGYYNGVENLSLVYLPGIPVNREVDPEYSDACVLKSIKFPEGGVTHFEYESNEGDSSIDFPMYIERSVNNQAYLSNHHTITPNGNESVYEFYENFTIDDGALSDSNFPNKTKVNYTGFSTRCFDNNDQIFGDEDVICENILLKIYKIQSGQSDQLVHSDNIWDSSFVLLDKNADYKSVLEITTFNDNYDFSQYESESTITWAVNNPNSPSNYINRNYFGGLRVKEIKNTDISTGLAGHRVYQYGGGKIMSKPSYLTASSGNVVKYVSQSWVPLLTTQSSYVAYKEVVEYQIPISSEFGGNTSPNIISLGNNFVKRTYTNQAAAPAFPTAPFIGEVFIGKQLKEEIPDIKKTRYEYTANIENITQPTIGFVIDRPYYIDDPTNPNYVDIFGTSQIETILLCVYTAQCDISSNIYTLTPKSRLPIGQNSTSYFMDDNNIQQEVVQSQDYVYDYTAGEYYNLMIKNITTNANNDVYETEIKYPYQLNNQNLISENRVATPLETINKKNGIINKRAKANYNTFNSHYLLDNVEASKGVGNYESRLVYHNYSSNGKPIEVSKPDGTSVFYIYGYQSNYPIAEIKNFTYAEALNIQSLIDTAVNASNADEDRTLNYSGYEGILRNKLDAIRNDSALANAQMTSYTYDPLVGITSVTDPKGYTVYYDYDDLQRMRYVKDKEGNILSENEYSYRN